MLAGAGRFTRWEWYRHRHYESLSQGECRQFQLSAKAEKEFNGEEICVFTEVQTLEFLSVLVAKGIKSINSEHTQRHGEGLLASDGPRDGRSGKND
jgi:hypothetical protein